MDLASSSQLPYYRARPNLQSSELSSKPSAVPRLPTDDKSRKELELWTFLMEYFPDAWLEVVRVAVQGNKQHNAGQPLHWARHKSTDQMNTAFRHLFDYGSGIKRDTDGQYHLAKNIWRTMAQLQLDIEADRREAAK
jgi:hypothetical protein